MMEMTNQQIKLAGVNHVVEFQAVKNTLDRYYILFWYSYAFQVTNIRTCSTYSSLFALEVVGLRALVICQ